MKTSVVKRVVALSLAALIILGTLGYFFSVVGFAAEEKNATLIEGGNDFQNAKYEIRKPNTKIKDNDQVSITIKLDAKASTIVNDIDGGNVEINGNKSAFEWKQSSSKSFVRDGATDTFVIKFDDLVYKSAINAGKLGFKIKNGSKPEKSVVLDLTSECESEDDDNNNDNDNTDPKPTPVESTMEYTLMSVETMKKEGGKNVFTPIYNFGSGGEQVQSPTIQSGQYATFRVRVSDPNGKPEDIKRDGKIIINAIVGGGSFTATAATKDENKDGSQYTVVDANVTEPNGPGNGISYVIEFTHMRYTGEGNLLSVTIRNKPDAPVQDYYASYQATISECVPRVERPSTDDDDTPDYSKMEMATPYVIISNYSYGSGGQVTAGDTFPLELTFYNTSHNLDVMNMMITITMPDAFMLTSSSNTFYVDQLDVEQSVTQKVQVTAKANAAPQSHNIVVSMKYQYIDDHLVSRRDASREETISVPVVQIDRFQVTGVEVSQEIYLNEESYLTVNFVNKGRSDVYNLSAQISGNIQNPGQQQNLGNLTSGSTGTADFYITPNGEGVCSGEVTITYEDTNMEEKTATIQWSTNAVDPMAGMDFNPGMDMPGMMEDPGMMEEETKSPTPFIIGGVVLAAAVAAFLIRRKILKKRSEEADAAL